MRLISLVFCKTGELNRKIFSKKNIPASIPGYFYIQIIRPLQKNGFVCSKDNLDTAFRL